MSMLSLSRPLALALGLSLAALTAQSAAAQNEDATVQGDAPTADGLSMGQDPNGVGSTYTRETFDSWEMRCVKTETGEDPCQLYQLLKDAEGTSVAEISLFSLPEGGKAAAGATVIVPLETLLTGGLRFGIDEATPKVYPFTFCTQIGCVSRVGFTAEEIESFKKGGKGVMTIVPAVAPDEQVKLDVSLAGFTAAYEAVVENNASLPKPAAADAQE